MQPRPILLASWLSSLLGAQAVWSPTPTSVQPPGRGNHASAYDLARQRLVVFGGSNGSIDFGDTWEFDGQTWRNRTPASAPTARWGHSMAFDPVRARVVLFGGSNGQGGTSFDDTWEWDGNAWQAFAPTVRPLARLGADMTFDYLRQEVVLFGGRNSALQAFGDLWHWNGARWQQTNVVQPPGRCCFGMAWDLQNNQLIVFGGWDGTTFGDTWTWDGNAWTSWPGPAPTARWGHRMTFDFVRGAAILHGGLNAGTETWEWNGTAWTLLTSAGPSRLNPILQFDVVTLRPTLYGGTTTSSGANDVWTFGAPLPGSFATFGAACTGSLGALQLRLPAGSQPTIGAPLALEIGNAPGPALLAFGNSTTNHNGTPLPLDLSPFGMPGCALLSAPEATLFANSTAGTARFSFVVPWSLALIGWSFHCQGFAFDPPANAAGLTASNGATTTIGRP